MHVQVQPSKPIGATAAAGAQAQAVITGVAGFRVVLTACVLGYSAANPATATRATIADGTTTLGFAIGGPAFDALNGAGPIFFASGASVTITLPAGAAGSVPDIAAAYYLAKADEVA